MRKLGILLVLSCFVMTSSLNAGWGSSRKSNLNTRSQTNQMNAKRQTTNTQDKVLFIQTAKEAVIQQDMYSDRGQYVLTLKGIQPNVAFFADRPQRNAGKIALTEFINDWSQGGGDSFQEENPNGALVTVSTTPSNSSDIAESVMILSEPQYDARNQTLTYKVRTENGKQIDEGRHANPVLFIDSGCYMLCF